ncbi:type II toxin-antitoxin system HicB family antitoxin [Herbidospora cretacea]|uniref:type II toxin-antitoxin system HicB family antitoxin n=1 Tax=Herbidospora cretacea TaxID=28444 RepID=UPI0004C38910|nr:type II toxin-antitoxin system HicB family antitoxin [Herbidospora cretacea]
MSQTVSLTATVTPDEEGWYVARCLQVEVASQGRTVDEALASLRDALELYFEDEPLPQTPQQPIVAPIEIRRSA